MQNIRQKLFTDWHFMRWLRLAFGVFFMVQAIRMHDSFAGVIGGFFLFTAATNAGCCGTGECATPVQKSKREEPEEIIFEEINSK